MQTSLEWSNVLNRSVFALPGIWSRCGLAPGCSTANWKVLQNALSLSFFSQLPWTMNVIVVNELIEHIVCGRFIMMTSERGAPDLAVVAEVKTVWDWLWPISTRCFQSELCWRNRKQKLQIIDQSDTWQIQRTGINRESINIIHLWTVNVVCMRVCMCVYVCVCICVSWCWKYFWFNDGLLKRDYAF